MGRVVSECPSTTLAHGALPEKTLVGNEQFDDDETTARAGPKGEAS
jgi:hypothetical protein